MLAKIDIERTIDLIEIETITNHKFDDIKIVSGTSEYFFQIKDFAAISSDDIVVSITVIILAGKPHKFLKGINILVFNPGCC